MGLNVFGRELFDKPSNFFHKKCRYTKDGYLQLNRTVTDKDIGKATGIDFSRKYLTTGDIRGIMAQTKKYEG